MEGSGTVRDYVFRERSQWVQFVVKVWMQVYIWNLTIHTSSYTHSHIVKNVKCSSAGQTECRGGAPCCEQRAALLLLQEDCMLLSLNTPHTTHTCGTSSTHTPPHSLGCQLCPQQRVSFPQSMLEEEVPVYETSSWAGALQLDSPLPINRNSKGKFHVKTSD